MTDLATPVRTLPLGSIRLRDTYCENALSKEIAYLLSLDIGRFLAGFYENAGIRTPYVRYGGWENTLIAGHTPGHYLSALAQACQNAGVCEEDKKRLFEKLTRIVDGLLECSARREGFLWAAPAVRGGAEAQFDNVEQGKTNIKTEAWVPWYTMHKLLAGLLDAFSAGYAPALDAAKALGGWIARRVLSWDEETAARVLGVEYGGMNDCLYELYACTGEERFARAAHVFDEEPLFDAILSERKNVLKDRHANTTIPKILGALKRYLVLHGKTMGGERVDAERYLRVARVFFKTVVERHTYVTGGNSEWEHFGADYVLDAERTNCNCETCNVYNMLKLARLLFCVTGDPQYTDYYDNAFVNTILSSQNPETGMTTYFQPMASGFFKVYSRPYDKFWCCTGSGMESFTKLGDSLAYRDEEGLFLEQYLSADVSCGGMALSLTADFPWKEDVLIAIGGKDAFLLRLRVPDWAGSAPSLKKNGEPIGLPVQNGHLCVCVAPGDRLELHIPVCLRLHGLPDRSDVFAFTYGNVVLSADLGTEDLRETETGVDVTIPARRICKTERIYFEDVGDVLSAPEKYLVRDGTLFRLNGGDISPVFSAHYRRYRERYAIYWHLLEGERAAEDVVREPLDTVQVGYGQYETDDLHSLAEHDTVSVTGDGTCRYAKAGGWFSYDLRVDPAKRNTISVMLRRSDNHKPLRIAAEDRELFSGYIIDAMGEEDLYRREFAIPADVAACARKKTVNGETYDVLRIRFEGLDGGESARVCEFLYLYAE